MKYDTGLEDVLYECLFPVVGSLHEDVYRGLSIAVHEFYSGGEGVEVEEDGL